MKEERIEELVAFSKFHVVVMGDVMLDEYIFGKADRISPEAPIPVVTLSKKDHKLGGAANVAMNAVSMGAQTSLIGLIGDDKNGEILTEKTSGHGSLSTYLIKDRQRRTTCKTRILASNQHLLRVDDEDVTDADEEIVSKVEKVLTFIHSQRPVNIIIFQDYNKGFFSQVMISTMMRWSKNNGVKTALDPKFNNIEAFKGIDIFKPNLKEVSALLGREVDTNVSMIQKVWNEVSDLLSCTMMVLTLSSNGIAIANKDSFVWEKTSVQSIVDVSGAGDTVMAVIALLSLQEECSLEEMAKIANYAGAAVCRKPGVAVVDKAMIQDVIKIMK